MAICRSCLHKVLRKHEDPDFFRGREKYKYYCEECDQFLSDTDEVAFAVIIKGNGKRYYSDYQDNPKYGD